MTKRVFIGIGFLLIIAYIIFSFRIITPKTGFVVDEKGIPISSANVFYMPADEYPNPGGSSSGEISCYSLKTDEDGKFYLPLIVRFNLFPFFYIEPALEIFKGKEYKAEFILPKNEFSEYIFMGKNFNKPVKLFRSFRPNEQIKNLEVLTAMLWEMGKDGYGYLEKCDKKQHIDLVIGEYKSLLESSKNLPQLPDYYYNLGAIYYFFVKDMGKSNDLWQQYLKYEPNSKIVRFLTTYEIYPDTIYSDFKKDINYCIERGNECNPIKFYGKNYPDLVK